MNCALSNIEAMVKSDAERIEDLQRRVRELEAVLSPTTANVHLEPGIALAPALDPEARRLLERVIEWYESPNSHWTAICEACSDIFAYLARHPEQEGK